MLARMSTEDIAAKLASGIRRPYVEGEIPDEVRLFPDDPKTFRLQPYTLAEEIDAFRAGRPTSTEGFELLRKAAVLINGSAPDENWLEKTSPGVRRLLTEALTELIAPSEGVRETFRKSLRRGAA